MISEYFPAFERSLNCAKSSKKASSLTFVVEFYEESTNFILDFECWQTLGTSLRQPMMHCSGTRGDFNGQPILKKLGRHIVLRNASGMMILKQQN